MHPILLTVGPITLYSYGWMVAIGFFVGTRLALHRARATGIASDRIERLLFFTFLGGIIGARAAYVFLNWSDFAASPFEVIRLDHGGLVFYGGLAGGVLTLALLMRRFSLPPWKTLDLLTPPFILAHAIGRIGCFLNGCCYGKPSSLPWAVAFPNEGIPRHPTQLYEAAALVLLFFILKKWERKSIQPGILFLTYGLLYGLWRFGAEFARGDSPAVLWNLTLFQMISLALAAVFGGVLCARRRSP